MKNKIIAFGLILLLSSFVVFLRFHSLSLPSIGSVAKSEVKREVSNQIRDKINKKYPDFSQGKRSELVLKTYKRYLKKNKYSIEDKIRKKSIEKKAFYRNNNNYTYLFGIDSYYWLRLIDNLINKGHIGDRVIDGKQYDDLMDEPIEDSFSRSMHLRLGSLIYKVLGFLKIELDYEIGLFFIPLLFSVLLAIATFFVTKLLSGSNTAAFFSGLAVNLSPLLLQRTIGEWLDTDIYSVFFPLLIFGAFLFVFKSSQNTRKATGVVVFSLACSLYASIWQGWWYIFDLLIICGLIFIINDYFSEHRDAALFKNDISWLSLLFVSGLLFVGLFNGSQSAFGFIFEPGKLIFALKGVPKDNWPNVFLTVAELKRVSSYRIVNELGGILLFCSTILGSIYLILHKKIMRDRQLGIGFFCLFIWLGALYYTSLNAIRFALLLVIPLGIMFGIVFDQFLRYIFSLSQKFSKKVNFSILGILVIVTYLVVSSFTTKSIKIVSFRLPLMNDSWHKSLTFIKENSRQDAIINSWWDYGHWYKAVANRRVLFDGKTQNSPIAFWVARVLTTDSEQEAVGILRMLNISKNQAFDLLRSYGFTHVRSMDILIDIAKLKEKQARKYLKSIMDKEKIDGLISLIFSSDMPEAYFITSYDMLGKMGSVSYVGNWDFKKGDIWINFSKGRPFEFTNYLKKEYGYKKEKVGTLLKDLILLKDSDAPGWISKVSSIHLKSLSNKFKKKENLLIFDNGMVFNLSDFSSHILRGPNVDIGIPYSVVYLKGETLQEKILDDSSLDFSVLLFKGGEEDSYKSVSLSKDLSKSMFVRMYFFGGSSLKYFKKVLEEKTPEGNSIYVYKIDWPK